jgi:KamA family protein
MRKVQYIRSIDQVTELSEEQREQLREVTEKYKFRANDYYLSLIDWDNPNDPIRKIVIPDQSELETFGDLDASNEDTNYVVPGCQHKYPRTALLMCIETCAAYCRFCFRKRLFMDESDEVVHDMEPGLEYIRNNEEITNVLLTGGDPLLLSSRRLEKILSELREIPHVGIIRIGTKIPAFNPYRIINDPELTAAISRYCTRDKRIYIMAHFNVPQELTNPAKMGVSLLMKAGAIVVNQTPVIRGINDNVELLADLLRQLSFIGVAPYYFFQCRPTAGNSPYEIPLVETYETIEEAKMLVSGLAKRARYVMSHDLGKIEMVGLSDRYLYFRFHRARFPEDEGRFMVFHRDDDAFWLDELVPADGVPHPVKEFGHQPAKGLGPE